MADVTDDYGCRVGMALRAVRQLHADAGRLLEGCDRTIGKNKRICTKSATGTTGLSSHVGGCWMAEGAFRYYAADPDKQPGTAEGVCLCFFGDHVAKDEPVLVVGQIGYLLDQGKQLADVCGVWDLWSLYLENCTAGEYGKVFTSGPFTWEDVGKSFDWFRLVAVPLYSITSLDDVVALMDRVKKTQIAAGMPQS